MQEQNKVKKQNLFSVLLSLLLSRGKPKQVPASLQERIDRCQTIDQLKALLLSKEVVLDEAMMAAFDKRIQELEQQTGKPFIF